MTKSNSNLNELTANNTSVGVELVECVVCGATGLEERINNHDCKTVLVHQKKEQSQ